LYSRLEYEALGPKIDFLAFLGPDKPKLGPENPKSLGNTLNNFRAFPQLISAYFALSFEPEMLESPSNLLKTPIVA